MKFIEKASAIASSTHTGRALKIAKFLNLLGTVRGAVTTVLLAASAIGVGTATVQTVRQDQARDQPPNQPGRAIVRPSGQPTPTPLTAAGLRADAEKRLQTGLAANAQAVDDLRKIAVLQGAPLDTLIAETKQRLQARYDTALTQVDGLLAPPASATGSPAPSPSLSVVSVNALVQVALNDMSAIVVIATRQATEPFIPPKATTPPPTPIRTVPPTVPPRTPSPTVRPSPTPSATLSH